MNTNRRKAFRTIADVLHSSIAELAALQRKPTQKTDRVMRSSKLEDSIYAELREDDTEMDVTENAAAQRLKSFPALSRDVFQSLYSLAPRKNGTDMLTAAAQKFNAPILDHVVQQDDYPTLKNICEGRSLPAYEAAAEFTGRAAEELDGLLSELGGDKGALNTLEKLETARDAAAEELAKLLDVQATGETTELGKQALINAANRLDSKQRQVEAVSQMLDTTMLRQKEAVKLAVSTAVQAATERAQEVQSIIGAWSDEPSNMRCTPENLALLEKVRQSPVLRDVSKYLGRFRELLAQTKKNSYAYGRGETYSLELGDNLSRALTSELAMLATPETIPLFLRKYQQRQIKQYRRREPIYKGKYAEATAQVNARIRQLGSQYQQEKERCSQLKPGYQCPTCRRAITADELPAMQNAFRTSIKQIVEAGQAERAKLEELQVLEKKARDTFLQFQKDDIAKLEETLQEAKEAAEPDATRPEAQQLQERMQALAAELEFGAFSQEEYDRMFACREELQQVRADIAAIEKATPASGDLDSQLKAARAEIDQCKLKLQYLAQYISKRAEMTFSALKMNRVEISLYDVVKSTGEVKDAFKFTYNGRRYDWLSLSEKIRAGMEVSELMKRLTGRNYPQFVDNMESVDDLANVRPTGQVIMAKCVSKAELSVRPVKPILTAMPTAA